MAVKCPECQTYNSSDSKYCRECATPLPTQEVSVTKTLETPSRRLAVGSVFAERYEIFAELGKGGMGEVYRVKDKTLDEEMALKVLKPEIAADKDIIERFKNELKLARKITHRNVCRMHDLNEEEETPYITMEYVEGEDLKSFIRRKEKLTEEEVIAVAKQVCEGLAEAHRLGVVHRDLKPQNIMIDKAGDTKVMDFGIARSVEAPGVTQSGVMIGTPDYISPEQAEGEEADQRSDIYALGVILYEMVTGSVPFKGDTAFSVALKHKAQLPQDPQELNPDISDNLSRLILICMEKDRERRYQTAEELLSDLGNIEDGLPLGTKLQPRRKTFLAALIRKKLFIPSMVVALVIIAVAIWQLLPQREVSPLPPSDRPSIAIMYFKNNTGEEGLDNWRIALSDLITSDLAQSKYIYVLSEDRLFNIFKELDLLEARNYTTDDLKRVASRGNVENILLGSYSKAGDDFRINTSIKNISSGEDFRLDAVEGKGEESYFSMVDELTRRIKENFMLSEEQIVTDIDKKAEQITTSSPEAYKYYVEGSKYIKKGENRKAIQFLQKAVEIDPEFAMAYRAMAVVYGNMGIGSEGYKYQQMASNYTKRLSERERYHILARGAETLEKRIEIYQKLLEIYPEDEIAIHYLGNRYRFLEQWDKAIERYEVNINNKRDVYYSYTQAAESYIAKGLYDKAEEVLEAYLDNISDNFYIHLALAASYLCQKRHDLAHIEVDKSFILNPTYPISYFLKGDIYLCQGDLIHAEKEYQKLLKLEEKKDHLKGRNRLGALYLLQGRFDKSIAQVRLGAELVEKLGAATWLTQPHSYLAYIFLRLGDFNKASEESDKALKRAGGAEGGYKIQALHLKGLAFVLRKSIDEAQGIGEEIKKIVDKRMNKKLMRFYYHLMGMIELKSNNSIRAIEYFNKALSMIPYQFQHYPFHNQFRNESSLFIDSLALAYYKTNDLEKAKEEYKRITSLTTGRLWYGDIYAKSFYMLGKIYEQQGDTAKAIEHYEKFLDLWKDADPGIAEVEDTRKRLAGMRGQ